MSTEKDASRSPSVAELQRFIREKKTLEFVLVNGSKIDGVLRWFDEEAFAVTTTKNEPLTLVRKAILSYRTVQDS